MADELIVMRRSELEDLLRAVVRQEIAVITPQAAAPADDPFLSIKEVCALLGITRQCVSNWTKEGKLTPHRFGAAVRYKKSNVLAAAQVLTKIPADVLSHPKAAAHGA